MQMEMRNIRDTKPSKNKPRLNAALDAPTIPYLRGRQCVNVFGSSGREIFAAPAAGKVAFLDTVCFNCPVFGVSPNGIGSYCDFATVRFFRNEVDHENRNVAPVQG